jgi:SpoVK/Ycf46/Vps4 family AAA+-type ATPase
VAVFTLARKIAPCIIFIDEIDAFLKARNNRDHDVTSMMKAIFLQMWDGLETASQNQAPVVVMGATNRASDIDPAFLRRMPAAFQIGLPNEQQRLSILQLILVKFRFSKCKCIIQILFCQTAEFC